MRWLSFRSHTCCYCGRQIRLLDRYRTKRLRKGAKVVAHETCADRIEVELGTLRVQRALRWLKVRLATEPEPDFASMTEPEIRSYLAGLGLRSDLVAHPREAQSLLHLARMGGRHGDLEVTPAVLAASEHHLYLVENSGG
jgi:hypothetical protein